MEEVGLGSKEARMLKWSPMSDVGVFEFRSLDIQPKPYAVSKASDITTTGSLII